MGPDDIRGAYVLYIGAGAVAAGGIISLVRSLPTIWHGLQGRPARLAGGSGTRAGAARAAHRPDLSMKFVVDRHRRADRRDHARAARCT